MLKSIALVLLLLCPQWTIPLYRPPVSTGGGSCTLPSPLTHDVAGYVSSNTCNGGSACTNGAGIDTFTDQVGTFNATQATSGSRPTYTTGAVNGLPAATFSASQQLNFTTAWISGINQTVSFYAILKPGGTGARPILGPSSTGFEWRINASNHQEILIANSLAIGAGAATLSSTNYSALLITFNGSTGAYTLYTCTAGTCSVDATGTNASAAAQTQDVNSIGYSNGDGNFNGAISEVGYYLGTLSPSSFGTYEACKYAI